MPIAPPHPCNHPGCNALIPRGERYCAAHQEDRLAAGRAYDATRRLSDPNLAEATRIHRGTTWRKVSELVRKQHPLCADPWQIHKYGPVPSAQTHHIFPLQKRPDLAYDMRFLAAVCTHCHARLERAEARGEETFKLFGFDGEPPEQSSGGIG